MPGLSSERSLLAIFTRERTFRFRPYVAISGARLNAYEGLMETVSLSFRDPQISRLRTRAYRSWSRP
jgi:hypothetical protein